MAQKTEAEHKQARKEALEKKTHEQLVRLVLKLEASLKEAKTDYERKDAEFVREYERRKAAEQQAEEAERKLRYQGVVPARLMIEHYAKQVDDSGDETTLIEIGTVCETVQALSWEVWFDTNIYRCSGYHISGITADYKEFDYEDVYAYTTPDRNRYELESFEDKEEQS